MHTQVVRLSTIVGFFFGLAGMLLTATAAGAAGARLEHVLDDIRGSGGQRITASTPSSTLLFERRENRPVLAPDGHQLTLGESNAVQGSISVKCVQRETRMAIHLTGLLPGGRYTFWVRVFKSDGQTAIGAAGQDPEGNGNVFTAASDGEADLLAANPAGPLTIRGEIGGCWLTDEPEVHLVGAYHIDGKSNGRTPGPSGTFIEQFVFKFKQLNRQIARVRDKDGNSLDLSGPGSTQVFESRQRQPILAPDGHQLTLQEYLAAQGSVSAKCNDQGTSVSVHMNGLVPNGVYTVWAVPVGPVGLAAGGAAIGTGALGGTGFFGGNIFFADSDGEADFAATLPGGPLSASGTIGACFLTDEVEVHVVVAYHLDGQAHGATPGSPGTFIEQGIFVFVRPPL